MFDAATGAERARLAHDGPVGRWFSVRMGLGCYRLCPEGRLWDERDVLRPAFGRSRGVPRLFVTLTGNGVGVAVVDGEPATSTPDHE